MRDQLKSVHPPDEEARRGELHQGCQGEQRQIFLGWPCPWTQLQISLLVHHVSLVIIQNTEVELNFKAFALFILCDVNMLLERLHGAARYAGLLLAPAEGFGLRTSPSDDSFFCPSGKTKSFYVYFGPNFGNFW